MAVNCRALHFCDVHEEKHGALKYLKNVYTWVVNWKINVNFMCGILLFSSGNVISLFPWPCLICYQQWLMLSKCQVCLCNFMYIRSLWGMIFSTRFFSMSTMVAIWVIPNAIGWKMITYKTSYSTADRDITSVGKTIKLIVRVSVWKLNH